MKATILYGARDVRVEDLPTPKITTPTDAVIRLSASCICGSDLWPYRGLQEVPQPVPMGHEYCGVVEEVGSAVRTVKPGQFVIGSFFASDNTCPHCKHGYPSSCQHRELVDEGVARIKELTRGVGADSVLECVGTQEAMLQSIGCARPGGFVSYVGVPHGVTLDGQALFFSHVHLHGGPAPVRRYLPTLIDLVSSGKVNPGKVFDQTLPLAQVAEGYRAMDERRAIKTLLRP